MRWRRRALSRKVAIRRTVAGLFADLFSAGSTIQELREAGVADSGIGALAILSGKARNLRDAISDMGIPHDQTAYYSRRVDEGAVLVTVRTGYEQRPQVDAIFERHGAFAEND